jgi:hypothetical protein
VAGNTAEHGLGVVNPEHAELLARIAHENVTIKDIVEARKKHVAERNELIRQALALRIPGKFIIEAAGVHPSRVYQARRDVEPF